MDGQRPIGWWVKRLDELLEQVVEHAVATEGLTRRHWQLLHGLASGGTVAELAPFDGVDSAVGDLTARGWLVAADGGPRLTDAGREAHTRLLDGVTAIRRQVTEGLSAEEYDRTLASLARMVANAERAIGREA